MTTKLVALFLPFLWHLQTAFQSATALTLPVPNRHHIGYGHEQYHSLGLSLTHNERDDGSEDPNDQSWITKWAAIGDSYSAGIGCGYLFDSDCQRYNFSFPSLINVDERMGDTSREFQFLACSGAVSSQILETQVPQIADGVQLVTVTAGGNDADFSGILVDCIYGLRPLHPTCEDRLADAGNLIQSEEFRKNINALISATLPKLDDNGRIYYVGYAPFSDAQSTQCNDVSWDFLGGQMIPTKLTTDLRTRLDVLVSQMNGVLGEIINAADDRVIFVDYSSWVGQAGGRFCEDGIKEPNKNNADAVFYQRGSVDIWEDPKNMAELAPRDYGNNTIISQITSAIEEVQASDPTFTVRDVNDDEEDPEAAEQSTSLEERGLGWKAKTYRVFHPTLIGHSMIANLVFYHMGVERAKMLDKATRPMVAEVLPSTCSRANEYQDGKVIPQTIDCADTADLSDDYWFDTDTARGIRDNFCKYVEGKNQTDISKSHDMESGLGMSYPYKMSGPGNTWVEVWVQNAGCRRPTLFPRESVCRVAIDAIVNQCNTESTRKFGGSAAFGTCEECHMRVGRSWIKFAKIAADGGSSWNNTSFNTTGPSLPVSDISFTRKETNETTI
ncbi:SGNH hydrolase, partial [Aureobasidium melanogenum]